jgi:1-acyl-sn-glycerol-3-phosphate acyltransferase
MQAFRYTLILEFLEKLFAALALGMGTELGPLCLVFLFGRRRSRSAEHLAAREVVFFLAMAMALVLLPVVEGPPWDRRFTVGGLLVLMGGLMVAAEGTVRGLTPGLSARDWSGAGLRNALGWVLFGVAVGGFGWRMDHEEMLAAGIAALVSSIVPWRMAYHRGDPGLLPLGAVVLALGVGLDNAWVVGLGLGWVWPAGLQVTENLGGSLAVRALLGVGGVILAGNLPGWVEFWASVGLAVMGLEFWRFVVRLGIYWPLRAIHRFRVYHLEHAAAEGPAIVISNHVTLADGWLLGAMTQRMVRFLVFDAYYASPASRFLLNLFRTIPIAQGARREAIESLRKAREVIEQGHFAGIFPEGGITRSGHLHGFQKGFTRIVAGTKIPIIPAYMNGLWTSSFSFSEGKVNLRLGRLFRDFEIEFGEPMPPTTTARELWERVKSLEVNAAVRDAHHAPLLPVAFLQAAARHREEWAAPGLRYGQLAEGALGLAEYLNRKLKRKSRLGIFLPEGPEKVIATVAAMLAGHVSYELDEAGENWPHGIGAVLTSQQYAEAHGLEKREGVIFVGRLIERSGAPWWWRMAPRKAWRRVCRFAMRKDSAVAIVDSPRGAVVLSHRGVWAAANSYRRVLWWKPGTAVRNQLPLSRAAGLTLGFWTVLLNGAMLEWRDKGVDFEVVEGDTAHADSKHVLIAGEPPSEAERYLPFLEFAEASGVVALSSPVVDFMNEKQGGVKAGTLGKLPFGLEIRGAEFRSPARCLRYLDEKESAPEWVGMPWRLEMSDAGYVTKAAEGE